MDNPELYIQVNRPQRFGAQQALFDFCKTINWRCDERDSVLDAGCGPGDVTADILMPILPANFSRLVGVDKCNKMIDYARKTYVRPNLSFELFDLDKDLEEQPFGSAEPFDHIFSFYVIMWISNLETCIRYFWKLLVPNGDLLIVYVTIPVYDVYKEQSLDKRWAKYMWDVDHIMPPFQHSKNPGEDFSNLLGEFDFTDCSQRVHEKNFIAEHVDSLRASVNPFLHRLPDEDREPFLNDLVQKTMNVCTVINGHNNGNHKIHLPYRNVEVYARKI